MNILTIDDGDACERRHITSARVERFTFSGLGPNVWLKADNCLLIPGSLRN
jgi:hypothetical protein